MNRKNLTAAVLAGLAGAAGIVGSAQAVNVNPDGLGQLLLYPYYTTNGGNQTIISVVNTTGEAKAVKVRFLEGQNSREVLDFNMYMSAYDVWTAALYKDADGSPTMVTNDTTCTVPYIYGDFGGVQKFLPWALNDEDPDGYADVKVRGTEGHFEMIEMGTLVDFMVPKLDDDGKEVVPQVLVPAHGSAAAATHKDGTPANCQQLVSAWTRTTDPAKMGYWIDVDPAVDDDEHLIDMSAPSGGLFGGAAIVNVQGGAMYSYDAKAINGFADVAAYAAPGPLADDLHQEPGTILPSLDSGGRVDAYVFADDGASLNSTGLVRGVDALSYVFMHDSLMNEYTTEDAVNAGTEWVITFPTKQFYVHQQFLNNYATHRAGKPTLAPAVPYPPFTDDWVWHDEVLNDDDTVKTPAFVDYPCEVVEFAIYDREEAVPGAAPGGPDVPPIVSPRPPNVDPDAIPSFSLCYETQVVRFGDGDDAGDITEILGSANYTNIDNTLLDFQYGWLNVDFVNYTTDKFSDGTFVQNTRLPLGGLFGLPATGFAVQRFENGFLGEGADVLANYGGIFQHKGTRSAD